jgi:thiamine-monophosphate kinase
MELAEAGELKLLEMLRERFTSPSESVIVDIGDDAAAVRIKGESLLLSTDTMTEGVHFDLSIVTPFQIGYKLVVSNVSDVYAMGGQPIWALLNVAIPGETDETFFSDFLDGISEGMKDYGVTLVGGDMSGSKSLLTSSLSLIGIPGKKIVRRSGASVGDKIYLSGPTGEAACGHEILKRVDRPICLEKKETLNIEVDWKDVSHVLKRFLLPEARDLSQYSEEITSMIDVSDGLFIDLVRLCKESSVGARIHEEKIPVTGELKRISSFIDFDNYRLITSGGEDYEQLFTAKSGLSEFIEIGDVVDEGLRILRRNGIEEEIRPEGYQHFASQR